MNVTRTITLAAAAGSAPGVYTERVTGLKYFTCISANGSFYVQFGQERALPIAGASTGATNPTTSEILTLLNTGASALEITFVAGPESYATQATVQAAPAGNYSSDSFLWTAYDKAWNTPATDIFSLSIPLSQPFRGIWCYAAFSNMQVGIPIMIRFSREGQDVLWLPMQYKADNTILPNVSATVNVGFALNAEDASRDATSPMTLFFNNSDGGGRYPINPMFVTAVADTIQLLFTAAVPAGTLRACLAVMSRSQPW